MNSIDEGQFSFPEVPREPLLRLEFLVGEHTGIQTLYPPNGEPVEYPVISTVHREACERFLQINSYAEIPEFGIESFTAMLGYNSDACQYEMWMFSSNSEQPMHMSGNFRGSRLILVSEPWQMPWGLQRLRTSFIPRSTSVVEVLTELWEPEGYALFKGTLYTRIPLGV